MEYIILGLLLLADRTIYQLRERIDKGLNLMYSSSMGSIQAAVRKLLRSGYISYAESVENGKYKKTYSITEGGRQYFAEWVNHPMETRNVKNSELAKIYFMGFSDKEKRAALIEAHLMNLKEQYQILCTICKEADSVEIPEEKRDILFYQLAAARYGRDFMKFNIDWYGNLLHEMKGNGEI